MGGSVILIKTSCLKVISLLAHITRSASVERRGVIGRPEVPRSLLC
jgi:hypothetical protein